jgi:hypothetical protein
MRSPSSPFGKRPYALLCSAIKVKPITRRRRSQTLSKCWGDRRLTLDALSDIITALGKEWEISVKLPETEVTRLTESEEFPFCEFNQMSNFDFHHYSIKILFLNL